MNRSTSTTSITQRGTLRGAALRVALSAGLAVTAVGCASSASRSVYTGSTNATRLAQRSSVTVDPNESVGRYDPAWYVERATSEGLPPLWLGEAVQASVDTQAVRAGAISQRIASQAEENAALSQAEASLRQALGDEQIAVADAEGLRQSLDARLAELTTGVSARESAIESDARLNDALVQSMVEERQAEFEAMRSQAVKEFEQAQAEHERMIAERTQVEASGRTELTAMVKIADLTQRRAEQKVAALRAQAEAVHQQTEARVADVSQQIQSLTEQIGAESSRLRAAASAHKVEGGATNAALLAKAESLAARDGEHEVSMKTVDAESALAKAKARFAEAQQQSDAVIGETKASMERMQAEAEKFRLVTDADYQQQIAATKRFREHNLADVFVQRARAERTEREARDEFVKAQAEAIAQAGREEAAHLTDLAQKQFDELKAQAEADAARIRAEVVAAVAQQMAQGATDLPGKSAGAGSTRPATSKKHKNANAPANANPPGPATPEQEAFAQTPAPAQPNVPAKPAVVEPEHVAAFRIALAESTRLRAQADAKERSILATYNERSQKLEAWRRQQETRHGQMIAEVGAFAQQAAVKAQSIRDKADKSLRLAQAEHDSAISEAEAFRLDTQAQITNIRAEAQRVLEESLAESSRMLAQAEALDAGGSAELRALEAQRDAAQKRGDAEARSLIAEAAAVETGQGAQVAQMRQEITSAQRILNAELNRLAQAAESFIQIAQASYDEAVTISDAFAEKTQIVSERMTIDNEVTRKIALAGVDHQRNLVNAEELAGQAEVERRLAHAAAGREQAEAADIARRAGVYAESQQVEASVNTTLATADARDENVRALFESRIASVQATRDRAFAQEYLSGAQRRARLAKAQAAAAAYRDLSSAAVALLSEKQQAFERSAKTNWDARLAMPAGSVDLEWPTLDPTFPPATADEPVTQRAFVNVNDDGSLDDVDTNN